MAKTPATVIAEINQYIIANGVGAINGPILNGVLQDLCNLVPPTPLDSGLMGYDSSGNPLAVSGGSGGTPGGTNGQLQYNNSGTFGGYGVGSGLSVVGGNLTATGGGVSGMQVVTSIAALLAIASPSNGQSAYLSLGGRSGVFTWSSADHHLDVAADPGQGIWVAPPLTTVTVTAIGSISPNVAGTYTLLGGTFNGNPTYSNGTYILFYYFPATGFWVISTSTSINSPSFFIQDAVPLPPSGTYVGQGGYTGSVAVVATSGASGAWQRQWSGVSDWAWWGAIADCVRTLDPNTWLPNFPTSTSTVTVGSGPLTFTIATGLIIGVGTPVFVQASGITATGSVTSYNSGTGVLVVTVSSFTGTGSSSSWTLTIATDNGQAFLNWQTWGQNQTAQGIGVKVVPSAGVTGVYGWRWTTTGYYWTSGICGTGGVDLHIDGRGAIGMQQLDNEGASTSFPSANGSGLTQANSFLINSTTIGATSFTCTTVAQAGNFTKGMTVLLMSLDEQYLGFPPNCFNYEYRLITVNGNTSTGVVSCDSIECEHLSTYPDFTYGGGFNCGAARVWVLGSHWDATQIYEGLIVGLSPTATTNTYVTFAIRKTITIDWVGVGFSETVSQSVTHIRAKRKTVGETDKLVGEINEYDCDTSVGIGCQSACPRQYNIYGGRYGAVTGWGQKFYASGATFNGAVTPGTTYGLSYGGILDNCRVVGGGIGSVLDGAGTVLTIDGTNATYANGIITLNVGPLEAGEVISGWAVIPGMILMLAGTATDTASLPFTGDNGALLVLTVTWNGSTQIFINTNGPAALPSWAVGTVRKLTVGPVTLRNCSGPDDIRNASDATDNGKPYYQWYHNVIMGNTTNPYATSVEFDVSGALVSFECDVVIAHPTSSATINIVFRAYIVTPSSITPNWITVNINIGVAGKRTITTTSFTGAAGTDSVTIGSGSASVQPLPSNEIVTVATGNITTPGATSPLIKVTMQSDTGISRKQIPPQNFGVQSLISAVVLPMQGQQQ